MFKDSSIAILEYKGAINPTKILPEDVLDKCLHKLDFTDVKIKAGNYYACKRSCDGMVWIINYQIKT